MYLFNEIYKWAENKVCEECLEYLVSIFMEPFDEIVNKGICEIVDLTHIMVVLKYVR